MDASVNHTLHRRRRVNSLGFTLDDRIPSEPGAELRFVPVELLEMAMRHHVCN